MKKHALKTFGDGSETYATALPASFTIKAINPSTTDAHRNIFYQRVGSCMIAKKLELLLDASDHIANFICVFKMQILLALLFISLLKVTP